MLNPGKILRYIKRQIGHPVVPLELEDNEILDFITEFTLQEFSSYCPAKASVVIDPSDSNLIHPTIKSRYYINDIENREILNISEIIWSMSDSDMMNGHPLYGAYTYNDLSEWALAVDTARNLKYFSSFNNFTYHFIHPNLIEITPKPMAPFKVLYECHHSKDFGTIPLQVERYFLDLCLADIQIQLGNIRKKFSEINTPFGTIPVDASIGDDGKELKDKVIEKLQTINPNIVIDIG